MAASRERIPRPELSQVLGGAQQPLHCALLRCGQARGLGALLAKGAGQRELLLQLQW